MKKKWGNVTIFYASRFTENLITLAFSAVYLMTIDQTYVNSFVYGSWFIGLFCNFWQLWAYAYKIRKYLQQLESGLNLDIWGVMKAGHEDLDMLQRYIRRAPQTILHRKSLFCVLCFVVCVHFGLFF